MSKPDYTRPEDAPSSVPTITQAACTPVVVDLVTAGRWLGIGRTTAYRLAELDEFPVPVLRVGHSYRVPTVALLTLLGLPVPAPAAAADAGPDGGARPLPGDGAEPGDAAVTCATGGRTGPGAPVDGPAADPARVMWARRLPGPVKNLAVGG